MAETAARHVNTMEAHHAPNWSRKQHVDGAHDKPSATSGSHGRKPHNSTRPKTKHAPMTPRFYGPDEARAHVLERDEPQPEFDVEGHVRLKPALHEDHRRFFRGGSAERDGRRGEDRDVHNAGQLT